MGTDQKEEKKRVEQSAAPPETTSGIPAQGNLAEPKPGGLVKQGTVFVKRTTLEERLSAIEHELKIDRWIAIVGTIITPVIVVLLANQANQKITRLNNELQAEIIKRQSDLNTQLQRDLYFLQATLTPYIESQKEIVQKNFKYYQDVKNALRQIDAGFEEAAYFEYQKNNKSLEQGLPSLDMLITSAPVNLSQELKDTLTGYWEFVSNKWQEFDSNPDWERRKLTYKESRAHLQKAEDALTKFITIPPPPITFPGAVSSQTDKGEPPQQ